MIHLIFNLGTYSRWPSWNEIGPPSERSSHPTHSMKQSPSRETNKSPTSQEIPPHFMELQGSLPHSRQPATCPCPKPDQSSPCPHSTSWRSISILSSRLRLGLPSGLFPVGSPPKPYVHLSCLPCVPHALPNGKASFASFPPGHQLTALLNSLYSVIFISCQR